MKMQVTILVICFVLAFSQMGDALKCYQNTNENSTKTLSDCAGSLDRCVGGKMSITMNVMGQEITNTQSIFSCALNGMCDSYCNMTKTSMEKSGMSGMKVTSCKTYCCTGDGCNKDAEEKTSDGYLGVANAKLVGIVMMFHVFCFRTFRETFVA